MMRAQTVSILFTDLVDSTAIRSSLGEERADELNEVRFGILTSAVDAHGGRVVKGTGDGMLAVFDSAADAIDAAVAVQQQADRYTRDPDAIGPLIIRAGISTGDITWDSHDDVAGTAVVEAARLEAQAQPSQILCTDITRVIARGRGGHQFDHLGEIELNIADRPGMNGVRRRSDAVLEPR